MTRKGFRNLLILSGISMLVLVAIQLYLFRVAYELKKVEFDSKVNTVLNNTVAALERKETAVRVRDFLNLRPPVTGRITTLRDSTVTGPNIDRKALRENRAYRDSIINSTRLENIALVFTERDSAGSMGRQHLQNMNLDSILKSQFSQQQLNVPFKYFIQSTIGDVDPWYTRLFATGSKEVKRYSVRLFPSFSLPGKKLLILEVNNRNDVLLGSLFYFFILSLLVFFLILFTLGKSILTLLRQKKISQVQKDFVNNVTHELKTPIASIGLAADALLNEKVVHDGQQVKFYAERIVRENNRMDEKIDKILLTSAAEDDNFKINAIPTDMHDIIVSALEQMHTVIEKQGAKVKTDLRAKNALVRVDEYHCQNLIVNLLDNSMKYAKGIPHIEIFSYNTAGHLNFLVSDKGIGISKNDQKHIFRKFFRSSTGDTQETKGFGIGLNYVYNVVKAHKGRITVQSTPGKGSTFIIRLPLYK